MPAPHERAAAFPTTHRIYRRIEATEGKPRVNVEFVPRFAFGRAIPDFTITKRGVVAIHQQEALTLSTTFPLELRGGCVQGKAALRKGDWYWLVLTHGPVSAAEEHLGVKVDEAEREWRHTERYWREWVERLCYEGPYQEQVCRSALALKLLVFQPTGGIIGAPTTSLPDEIGGERNWDYRYTWLRDSGMLLDALQQLGYHDESKRFIDWLGELPRDENESLRIMYRIDGTPAPDEQPLPHLAGYKGSSPVRVGNGATNQNQIDVYGHVIEAAVLCYERQPRPMSDDLWRFLRSLADEAAAHWQQPDHGPWEMRGESRHYVYSKLYCWVGLDRAIRYASQHGLPGDVEKWKRERSAVREAILSSAFDRRVGAFTQAFGVPHLDASVMAIPNVGFLPGDDPRVVATYEKIGSVLAEDGLVYRYRMDDGLPGRDHTFTLCSFWMVINLAMGGDQERAEALFEHICGYRNDVGLMSEQIDAQTGLLLGNFPQGFTHLGMIRAALQLDASERCRGER